MSKITPWSGTPPIIAGPARQRPSAGARGPRDALQQPRARRVVPVVQDHRHHVHVRFRDAVKEVTGHRLDAAVQPQLGQPGRCGRHHMGRVEHDPATRRIGVSGEQRAQDAAVGAADVGHGLARRQGIAGHRADLDAVGEVGHGAGEALHLVGLGGEPVEERAPVVQVGRRRAAAHALQELAERGVVGLHPSQGQIADRSRSAGGECLAQRGHRIDARLRLTERTEPRETADETAEHVRMGTGPCRQVGDRGRTVEQRRGHVELGCHVQRLCDLKPGQQLHHLHRRRRRGVRGGAVPGRRGAVVLGRCGDVCGHGRVLSSGCSMVTAVPPRTAPPTPPADRPDGAGGWVLMRLRLSRRSDSCAPRGRSRRAPAECPRHG